MKLAVIQTEESSRALSKKETFRIEVKGKYDRAWLTQPESFDPSRKMAHLLQEERLFQVLAPLSGSRAADLGSGWGNGARFLAAKGFQVDAVDIAQKAVSQLDQCPGVKTHVGFVPYLTLDEGVYDVVLAANLIAEVPEPLRRLALSQFAVLLKPEGVAVISTPLDIDAEDALPRFLSLVQTEFTLEAIIVSYFGLNRKLSGLTNGRRLHGALEKLSAFFYPERGISDVIVVAKLKGRRGL